MTFAGVSELTPGPGLPSGQTVTKKLDVAVMSDAELATPAAAFSSPSTPSYEARRPKRGTRSTASDIGELAHSLGLQIRSGVAEEPIDVRQLCERGEGSGVQGLPRGG